MKVAEINVDNGFLKRHLWFLFKEVNVRKRRILFYFLCRIMDFSRQTEKVFEMFNLNLHKLYCTVGL